MLDIQRITDDLKIDEGFRGCAYRCTANKITIGYGHNIQDNPLPEYIAEKLLQHDIGQAIHECERFPWFYLLSSARKEVIINMTFNLGIGGVSKFKKMIEAINQSDFDEAAKQMLDSKWAGQVGKRAIRLSVAMRFG